MRVLWCLLLVLVSRVASAEEDVVRVFIDVSASPDSRVEVRATWLGEERRLPLQDVSGLGMVSGILRGPPLRLLPVSIWLLEPGGAQQIYASLEVLGDGGGDLVYSLGQGDDRRAHRISVALPGGARQIAGYEATIILLSLTWACAVLGLVLWLTGRAVKRSPSPPGPRTGPPAWWERPSRTLLLWLALAVVWTWPALLSGERLMVGRHFDLPGVIWSLHAAGRLLPDLQDTLTAWPLGADYTRFDSYLLLPLAPLAEKLGPTRLHGLLQVFGLAVSAWSMEAFAREIGARAPWTLLAGLGFALSGLGASVLLEGHVFHLMDPWLPLFGLAWWRALGPRGRPWHGVAAGLAFIATLLTTAYLGVAATIIAVGFFVGALATRGWRAVRVPALAAAAVVSVLAGPYVLLFLGGTSPDAVDSRITSATLANLAAPTPELDRARNSQGFSQSALMLSLALVAPLLVSRTRTRILLGTGGVALLLAMGPTFGPDANTPWFPLPLAAVMALGGDDFLRFPARLAWAWLLCGAVIAARMGTHLEDRLGPRVRILLLIALIEPFVTVRLLDRQAARRASVPPLYATAGGPLLDLYPDSSAAADDREHLLTRLSCFYQTEHGLPIAEDCIGTVATANPRYRLGRWLTAELMSGRAEAAAERLAAMGFAAVVFHPDLFMPGDRARLSSALEEIDPEPEDSIAGASHLRLFRVPDPAPTPDVGLFPNALEPATAIGVDEPRAEVRTLRLQVQVEQPDEYRDVGFYGLLTTPDGETLTLRARNDGAGLQDMPGDDTWVGDGGPVPGAFSLDLISTSEAGDQTIWSGPVSLQVEEDQLTFRLEDDGTVHPLAAAPAFASPELTDLSGRAALIGWGVFALLAGVGIWRIRRETGAASTDRPEVASSQ